MAAPLEGRRIAILATDGFEEAELLEPRKALELAGAMVEVVAPHGDKIQGMRHHDKADFVAVDCLLEDADPASFHALVLPGGVASPDDLRTRPEAVQFAKAFFDEGKPVAAICHGPWTLVEAGVVRGRKLTSWPSLKTDILNAGGEWTDQEVVSDHGLVTSRKPDDLPAFCSKMIEEFAEGRHGRVEEGRHGRVEAAEI
jgi:protease I